MYDLGLKDKKDRPLRRDERIAVYVMLTLFLGAMTGGFLGTFIHQWFPDATASSVVRAPT